MYILAFQAQWASISKTADVACGKGKGDIPNENFRLPPPEVHFGVGYSGRTDSGGGAGQQ